MTTMGTIVVCRSAGLGLKSAPFFKFLQLDIKHALPGLQIPQLLE